MTLLVCSHDAFVKPQVFFLFKLSLFSLLPDVDVPVPDEKSVITYVSSIYDAFPKIPEGGEGIAAHVRPHRHSFAFFF